MNLRDMTKEVREVNEANGWFDVDRTFGDAIALLHTEVSEAFEAFRAWGFADHTPIRDTGGTVRHGAIKPEGVGSELADILIRLIDTADRYGFDLEAEYRRKLAHNRTRGYHHGGKKL
jgi:NTP pyrophosphatase (non-canonical NTP hydrolase)